MLEILIAGAGIGGLALVRALQGLDCAIEVAERLPVFNSSGFGIVLHPNGLEVLARLGLLNKLNSVSNVIARMEIIRDGTKLTIPLSQVWEGAGQATRMLLRSDLHQVLRNGALDAAHRDIRWRMGSSVVGVEVQGSRPMAHFQDGSCKAYDLIVGADGVHSSVRQRLIPEAAASLTGLFCFRWLADNVIGLEQDTWRTIQRADWYLGFIPVGSALHCFVHLITTDVPCVRGEEASWLERAFDGLDCPMFQTLRARRGPIHADFAWTVYPAQWGIGRCVLLGDSAHAISPTLSEGGSLAMEDALALAVALRESNSVIQAIELYRDARQERIAWALRMSQAQLNSLRRRRTNEHTNSEMATSYLRQIYEPLRSNTLQQPDRRVFSNSKPDQIPEPEN